MLTEKQKTEAADPLPFNVQTTMFLLRFVELCSYTDSPGVAAGTTTITAVNAEAMDFDPDRRGYHALSESPVVAGTQRATRVRAESSDSDLSAIQFKALPASDQGALGTCTATNVNAEALDADPVRNQYSSLR